MPAMNPLRRFLLRGGMASRMMLLAAFAVLFARALLPGAVMLDPESAAQGDFALVICSGHGPMFAPGIGPMSHMDDSMPGMDMSHMPGMTHDGMTGSPAHDSMTGDDGLCPFSAALFVACVGITVAVVLFALKRQRQSWRVKSARPLARSSHYFRPLSRAPPSFS
jgi:hypothetical protein